MERGFYMRKKLIIALAAILCVCCLFSLAACNNKDNVIGKYRISGMLMEPPFIDENGNEVYPAICYDVEYKDITEQGLFFVKIARDGTIIYFGFQINTEELTDSILDYNVFLDGVEVANTFTDFDGVYYECYYDNADASNIKFVSPGGDETIIKDVQKRINAAKKYGTKKGYIIK